MGYFLPTSTGDQISQPSTVCHSSQMEIFPRSGKHPHTSDVFRHDRAICGKNLHGCFFCSNDCDDSSFLGHKNVQKSVFKAIFFLKQIG